MQSYAKKIFAQIKQQIVENKPSEKVESIYNILDENSFRKGWEFLKLKCDIDPSTRVDVELCGEWKSCNLRGKPFHPYGNFIIVKRGNVPTLEVEITTKDKIEWKKVGR